MNDKNKESKIMSLEEIQNMKNINEEMVKEYCRLGEERLRDCLDTKKQFEQKAFILLSGYITISLALFSLSYNSIIPLVFSISAVILLIGIILLLWSMKFSDYGNLGRSPKDWLENDRYLTIKKEHQALIYTYNLEYLVDRINTSNKSNAKKRQKIIIAIYLGVISIIPFIILFFHQLHFCLAVVVDHL